METVGSKIFEPFRAVGLCSSHIPCILKYHVQQKQFYIIVPIGRVLHVYNTSKLALTHVSDIHPQEITCVAANDRNVFTASGNIVRGLKYHSKITFTYNGHENDVHLLLPFGNHLISVDTKSCIKIWDILSEDLHSQMFFDNKIFEVSALMHPSTYLNKILLASRQGTMQLWNIRKNVMVYEFAGWNSAITQLVQAPAVDVVAVGTVNGDIIIHNIKVDQTVLKFHQDFGPVTAISFRTDGEAVMVSASTTGKLSVWDLQERRLIGIMKSHRAAIAGACFMHGQPLLVTNASDNSVKIWAFDQSDGLGRELKMRDGHSGPPTKLRFHDDEGMNILSSSMDCKLRSFSTEYEGKNKSLGTASTLSKNARKKKRNKGHGKLPPIVGFCSGTTREGFWDNIVAYHHHHPVATTWNFKKGTIGEHKLMHPRFSTFRNYNKKNEDKIKWNDYYVTSITMTSCGNFCIIGTHSGHADVFNIQSGIHRGTFVDPSLKNTEQSHTKAVRGICVNALNQICVTAGSDGFIKFWKFKTKTPIAKLKCESSPAIINLHKGSSMLAVALDDFQILICDVETRRVVRRFFGHKNIITDMTWSEDGRWLITSGMDCTVRTWDLPSGSMVDCFLVDTAVTSLTLSPTSDLLATSHVDELGIYLWSNKSIFSYVSLQPLAVDFDPEESVILPSERVINIDEEVDETEEMENDLSENIFKSKEQLDEELITLSGLPNSRWANLLMLDVIKEKNKPKQPPKIPKHAPFFLPTVAGLTPTFDVTDKTNEEDSSKITTLASMESTSNFGQVLLKCYKENSFLRVLNELKSMGPSAIDREIRCMSPEMGGSVELIKAFLEFLLISFKTKVDFEILQAYLGLLLKVHAEIISSNSELVSILCLIKEECEKNWPSVQNLFNQSICLVNFIKSSTL